MRGFGDYEIDGTFSTTKARDYKDATDLVIYANKIAPAITSSGPPYSRTGNQRVECDALIAFSHKDNGADASENITPTLRACGGYGKNSGDHLAITSPQLGVRRLTPTEAERLQGFPDGHTDIGWKGKPTPDSHRYKAMGNSMAVPVMRWIGERIQARELKRQINK